MLSKEDTSVLEEIVNVEGKCMNSERCKKCPFRSMCLPEFLYPNPPTNKQRMNMALDILCHNTVIDPSSKIEDFTKTFRKLRKQNIS